jgi:predicted nucleic acid-binding Zn ribbon protein
MSDTVVTLVTLNEDKRMRQSKPKRVKKTCPVCGRKYLPYRVTQRYCSDKCRQANYRKLRKLELVQDPQFIVSFSWQARH